MENSTIEVKGKKYVVAYDDNRNLRLIPADKYDAFADLCYELTGCSIQLVEVEEVTFGAGDVCTVLRRYDDIDRAEVWKMDAGAAEMAEVLDADDDCYDYEILTSATDPDHISYLVKECEETWSKL